MDDENAADGRPVAPDSAAIFWGSDSAGWRLGNWFATTDAGSVRDVGLSEIDPPRDGSTQARRVSGAGVPAGAVLWLELDHPGNRGVDLSAYSGISFWARLESESGGFLVAVNDGTRPTASFDGAALASRALSAGSAWQEFTLPFDSFAVERRSLLSIEFFVGQDGGPFDLWIDDLAFLCTRPCP